MAMWTLAAFVTSRRRVLSLRAVIVACMATAAPAGAQDRYVAGDRVLVMPDAAPRDAVLRVLAEAEGRTSVVREIRLADLPIVDSDCQVTCEADDASCAGSCVYGADVLFVDAVRRRAFITAATEKWSANRPFVFFVLDLHDGAIRRAGSRWGSMMSNAAISPRGLTLAFLATSRGNPNVDLVFLDVANAVVYDDAFLLPPVDSTRYYRRVTRASWSADGGFAVIVDIGPIDESVVGRAGEVERRLRIFYDAATAQISTTSLPIVGEDEDEDEIP